MVRGLTARCCPRCSTKNRWSSVGKVLPPVGGEILKAPAGDRHEIGNAGQVPVRVGYFDVTDVGRECGHGVVDIGTAVMPKLDTPANKRVPKIMDANLGMCAAIRPALLSTDLLKDAMDRPLWKWAS